MMQQPSANNNDHENKNFDTTPVEDYQPLDPKDESKPNPGKKKGGPSFFRVIVQSTGRYYMIGAVYKFVYDIVGFISPQILK